MSQADHNIESNRSNVVSLRLPGIHHNENQPNGFGYNCSVPFDHSPKYSTPPEGFSDPRLPPISPGDSTSAETPSMPSPREWSSSLIYGSNDYPSFSSCLSDNIKNSVPKGVFPPQWLPGIHPQFDFRLLDTLASLFFHFLSQPSLRLIFTRQGLIHSLQIQLRTLNKFLLNITFH